MLRVGLSGETAATRMQALQRELTHAGERLATARRLNHGSDDPAALIAATQLAAELESQQAAQRALERSDVQLDQWDSGLSQTSDLLVALRGQVVAAADGTLSPDQQAAAQLEIDATLAALDRVGGAAGLSGQSLTFLMSGSGDTAQVTAPAVSTTDLGSDKHSLSALRSNGELNVGSGQAAAAVAAVDAAQARVSFSRANLGAFASGSVDTSLAEVEQSIENASQSLSLLADANLAEESARYVRTMVLVQATIGVMRLGRTSQLETASLLNELIGD